jgi:transposase
MAGRGRPKEAVRLTRKQRRELLEARSDSLLSARAFLILLCDGGRSDTSVAEELGTTPHRVGRWRRRYLASGIRGLMDLPRSGAPRKVSKEEISRVSEMIKSPDYCTVRDMAIELRRSTSTVHRVLRRDLFSSRRHWQAPDGRAQIPWGGIQKWGLRRYSAWIRERESDTEQHRDMREEENRDLPP